MWTLHWIRDNLHHCEVPDACSSIGSKRFCDMTCLSMCKSSEDSIPVGGGGAGEQNASTQRPGLTTKCGSWLCAPSAEGKRCKPKCHWWKSICTKVFLIVVNFSFLIAGWAMVVLGIYLHVHQDSFLYAYLLKDNVTNPVVVFDRVPFFLIGVGLFLAAMSFLGCCGACADSICFLTFYTILLAVVILTEIVLGAFSHFVKDELARQLMTSLQYQVRHEYNKTARPANVTALEVNRMTLAWDTLQLRMNCCGAEGPGDYFHSAWFNQTQVTAGSFVPLSCCFLIKNPKQSWLDRENLCQVDAIIYPKNQNDSSGFLKTQGCQPVVMKWVYTYEWNVAVIISIHVLIQLASLILGCVLMTWVRKKHADYWWCEDEEYE